MIYPPGSFDGNHIQTDIAIIGAGAAGITLAHRLMGKGQRICLVESGDTDIDMKWQNEFRTASVGHPTDLDGGRWRTFGGSTSQWTGRCAMLDAEDFEAHEHIDNSGWPISLKDLAPYYAEAAGYAGFEKGRSLDAPSRRTARLQRMFSDSDALRPFLWRFHSESRDYFRHWGDSFYDEMDESAEIDVLLGCDAVGISAASDSDAIKALTVRTRAHRDITISAKQYVVTAGCVENTRLLLNWERQAPAHFAKVNDSIGRWFMQHPRAITATVTATQSQAYKLQSILNRYIRRKGLQDETGITLSPSAKQANRLGNASAILRYSPLDGARPLIELPRRVWSRLYGAETRFARPHIDVIVDLEQEPDRESRVLLNPSKDILGIYQPTVDWRINDLERRTSAFLTRQVGQWIEDWGLGHIQPVGSAINDGGLHPEHMAESYHPLGSTRMSTSAQTGVVDSDLRVHGIDNLYICGGSVFPTGGHANPTLTIVALALRLADTVAARRS